MGFRERRSDGESFLESFYRGIRPFETGKSKAEVMVSIRGFPVDFDSSTKKPFGFFELTLLQSKNPKSIKAIKVARVRPEYQFIQAFCFP